MVLECIGVWLHIFDLMNAEAVHLLLLVLWVPIWSAHLGGIKRHIHRVL